MLLVTKLAAFLRFHIPIQRTFDSLQTCPESPALFPDHPDTCPTTHSPKYWDPKTTPYPHVRRDSNSSDVFQSKQNGPITVPDPYRWLDKPPKQSKDTETLIDWIFFFQQFVTRQQAFTKEYLSKYSHRGLLRETLKKSWNYARIGCPLLQPDGYYYYYFTPALDSQFVIYRFKKGEEEGFKQATDPRQPVGELFLDPNLFSIDGTTQLGSAEPSESGIYMAYEVSPSGSNSQTIYVRRTDRPHTKTAADGGKRGEDAGRMKDTIKNVKYSYTSWMKDDSAGFFYSRFPDQQPKATAPGAKSQGEVKLYFHKLGDPQSKDQLILTDPANPSYLWAAQLSDDGKYLIVINQRATVIEDANRVWVADLTTQTLSSEMKWQKVVNDFGSRYAYVANDDSRVYFMTNKDAPKYKVVTYDLSKPEEGFKDLVPEDPTALLRGVYPINNNLVILDYLRDAKDEMYLHEIKSGKRIKRIGEEFIGSFDGFSARRKDGEFFLYITSFTSPTTVYRYRFEPQEDQTLVQFSNPLVPSLNPEDFVSKQVFYESKDGTKVPMFIVHKKDFKQDGTAPAIQPGYGAFSDTSTPSYSATYLSFVAHYGGVLAVPNIRGGGEYGEEWHLAGCLEKKQNVFDDFQYATKYLIANRYVAPNKVTIMGNRAGGLLVAACVNQAPELYGAAIAEAGLFDMLRFQRSTTGRYWISEYGDPENPEAFDYLIKYSPLQNVNPAAQYPALMLLTADNEDQAVLSDSFKYTAAVQHALPMNKQPCLLRFETNAGHGAGKKTEMELNSVVDQFSFIALALGLDWKEYHGKKSS
ncbi:hypothetical protein PTTG_04237 [Puccinia triticina 1-1 BBBD Race 1]|uniref:Prolyl endopeptidase n=1 Tax=Puccinia triticina (isolate 1-1 / race 1 (BBBD)) TaxID=630390 RepID=A0A180GAT2_PUCT1|nr:hypothetical protein PTTG_04237 [Puccinia triticina 1-1 BBBD Race 1]